MMASTQTSHCQSFSDWPQRTVSDCFPHIGGMIIMYKVHYDMIMSSVYEVEDMRIIITIFF